MAASSTGAVSITKDGVLECVEDGIHVQRVPAELLVGSEDESFDFCNTCNHHSKFKLSFFDSVPDDGDKDSTEIDKIRAWREAGARWRAWYDERIAQTKMENWFRVLGDLCGDRCRGAIVLKITAQQQKAYFEPASQLAQSGANAKLLLEDEAKQLATQLVAQQQETSNPLSSPPPNGWFVRTSACSPKDAFGDGGSGPHHSLEGALLALMASERIHKTIRKYNYGGDDMVVYLMPFDSSIDIERELRVYVHQNKVRAISQYDVHHSSNVFGAMTTTQLARVARAVDNFHGSFVKPRWTINTSYTMDVEYRGHDDEIWLMELNSFGAEMAASSGLFHWERDETILYGSPLTQDDDAGLEDGEERPICIRVRS